MPDAPAGDILVIDDDPGILQFVVDALEDHGYAARGAANGEEGLMAIHARQPALVVLDLILPGLSGAPLMTQIWMAAPQTPVVLMTAVPERAGPLGEQYGLSWFAKPFSVQTLLTVVGHYLPPSA